MGPAGAEVGRYTVEGILPDLGQCTAAAATQRTVEEARDVEGCAEPPGEGVSVHQGGPEVVHRGVAGFVGDEGNHVEHAQTRGAQRCPRRSRSATLRAASSWTAWFTVSAGPARVKTDRW